MRRTISSANENTRFHLTARIGSYEIVNDANFMTSKYIMYLITISTYYKSWIVKRRYTQFEQLNSALCSKIQNLPLLPPKRLFSSSKETIKERKTKFEKYLNHIFKNCNVCLFPELLAFIEVDKELLVLYLKSNSMIERSTSTAVKNYYSMLKLNEETEKKPKSIDDADIKIKRHNTNYYTSLHDYKLNNEDETEKSANMLVIEEFLRNLEQKWENRSDVVKTFEQFLKGNNNKQWLSFRKEEIQKLYFGEFNNPILGASNAHLNGINNNSNIFATFAYKESQNFSLSSNNSSNISVSKSTQLKGLLHYIGNIEQNNIGSESCLEFLSKLLDYEFNPDCENYIFMLKYSKIENLLELNLQEHLNSNKPNVVQATFKILKAILSDDKYISVKAKRLIGEENSIKFKTWLESDFTC